MVAKVMKEEATTKDARESAGVELYVKGKWKKAQ
jgi:hypothetical protein